MCCLLVAIHCQYYTAACHIINVFTKPPAGVTIQQADIVAVE